jgi:hypothetical protein
LEVIWWTKNLPRFKTHCEAEDIFAAVVKTGYTFKFLLRSPMLLIFNFLITGGEKILQSTQLPKFWSAFRAKNGIILKPVSLPSAVKNYWMGSNELHVVRRVDF